MLIQHKELNKELSVTDFFKELSVTELFKC